MSKTKEDNKTTKARSSKAQENILINLAAKLAEKKLRDGTASSQLICLLLSEASEKKKLENEKLRMDIELSGAKVDQIKQAEENMENYRKVIEALKRYRGIPQEEYDEDEYYDD